MDSRSTSAALSADPDAAAAYEFRHEIARGGMGSILEAADCRLGRTVAVKIMLSEMGTDAAQKQRFINEAAVLARLAHPNIVPVYDIGRDPAGQLFYSMKLVKGRTLQAILNGIRDGEAESVKHYTLDRLLTVFRKVCDALAFAHSRGIIHRDLKPENIMVGEFGEVLVMDWGLAKDLNSAESRTMAARLAPVQPAVLDADRIETLPSSASDTIRQDVVRRLAAGGSHGMTLEGDVMGTPQYMSPEQAAGRIYDMDARSDIFSLGGILYTILTLRPPVEGKTLEEVLQKVTSGSITSPTALDVGAPRVDGEVLEEGKIKPLPHCPGGRAPAALSSVVMHALSVDKTKRYQAVAAFSTDVEAYQNGFATHAENAGAWRQFVLLMKRHKGVSLSLFILLLASAGFMVEIMASERRATSTLDRLRGTAPTFFAQARGFLDNGKTNDALEKIAFALELTPGNVDYLHLQADALETGQQFAAAAAAYRRVLVLRPDDAAVKDNLTLCEKLNRDHPDGTGLTVADYDALYTLIARQQRAESHVFGALAGKKKEAYGALIQARLKPLMEMPQWSVTMRLRQDAAGGWTLFLYKLPVSDIEFLRGLPLEGLRLDGTGVADLSPLAGMPLKFLQLGGLSKVTDLSPLRGAPLEEADFGFTGISDLRPMTGMPLRKLNLGETRVTDISPLRGLPLENLSLGSTPAVTLEPLRGMKLRKLDIGKQIADLSPLAGMPIEWLNADHNDNLRDISPLACMPLRELYIGKTLVKDVSPLATCRELEILSIPEGCAGVELLRQLPKLRLIGYIIVDGTTTAEKFWKEYDAKKAAGGK